MATSFDNEKDLRFVITLGTGSFRLAGEEMDSAVVIAATTAFGLFYGQTMNYLATRQTNI